MTLQTPIISKSLNIGILMNKKETIEGFFCGISSNIFGFLVVIFISANFSFNPVEFYDFVIDAKSEKFLGKLISLGAIMNLFCFFYFLRKNNDSKAAGVLIATVVVAIFTLLIKLL